MNRNLPFILANLAIILVGVIYNTMFEFIEAEILVYGQIAIIIGLALFLLIPIFKNKIARFAGMLIYFFLGIFQILPIILWLTGYNVTSVADTSYFNVPYTLYLLPHLAVLCFSFRSVYCLLKYNKLDKSLDN